MAMTKAEQAQMEALKMRLALAWTTPPVPIDTTVALEASAGEPVVAWSAGRGGISASIGWFDRYRHQSYGEPPVKGGPYKSATRDTGGPWFYTESEALRWSRHAAELRFAAELRKADLRIEAVQSPPSKGKEAP